ncbi:MAG: alpha/beta fold hydrolase [Myxococcota bacterium]
MITSLRIRLLGISLMVLGFMSCLGSSTADAGPVVANGVIVTEEVTAGIAFYHAVPEGLDPETPLPMVVHLHGRGDDAWRPNGPFLDIETPMRVILPRAPERYQSGFAWMPVSASRGESRELVDALDQRTEELAEFLEELTETYPTLGKPIVLGFSQGGMLSFTLALNHPEVVGRAFPLAGYIPPSRLPARYDRSEAYPKITAMHGMADPILRVHRTRAGVSHLSNLGYDVELFEYPGVEHVMTSDMYLQLSQWLEQELLQLHHAGEAGGFS